ncbi:hypothetical protein [Gramella sp. MAR_2010_147]|uniref:hypothetical protein n=1 Tax=Gramella sp. MAR_2010_147 TaxID=1250205 RepID=UPI00087AE6B7|nr:hypothetical protein [Gramella sp. MAR_2010_147]SDR91033.1 hypothetical protein SAMN04488553_1008 [Gramella sp. MAR_2010_147]
MNKILKISIGSIQIIGGLFLIYAIINRISEVGMISFFSVILPFILITGLCLYAGIQLIRNKGKGIKLSILNFGLQLFQFSYLGFYWYYFIGPYVSFGYQKPRNSNYTFLTDFEYFTGTLISYIRNDTESHFLAINLVSLVILIFLFYLKQENSKEPKLKKNVESQIQQATTVNRQ